MKSRKAKLVAVLVVALLVVLFVPPNINGTRFRDRLAPALSAALGRQVKIGTVKYRLLPRPGFDLYDFQVMDDPSFGAEPMLVCGKVTADLRLTSLWQGRLEFANLKLTDDAAPPSLNLTYSRGHWNLESLLVRAEQLPSAPTGKRRAERRTRFPYIEASGGRINFKNDAEKKSYSLANTDFAVWLASEDLWHVRLEGRPVRTDMNLNDTGTVKLEGDLHRASSFEEMPLKLNLSWEKTQLGQFSKLLWGQDGGWRGDLGGNAELNGTPANLHLEASIGLGRFHRYDVNRSGMLSFHARCLGDYVNKLLELKCETPFDPGGVLLSTRWSAAAPLDYDLSVVANHVPLSALANFSRSVRAAVPEDLSATGDLNAAFGFHYHNGTRDWHGAGMTSAFLLQSAATDKPFPVSSIRFHVGAVENTPSPLTRVGKTQLRRGGQPETFTVEPFSVQLGPSTALEVQGSFDATGYRASAKGLVPLERLLAFGQIAGLDVKTPSFTASAVADLSLSGSWRVATPPRVTGTAHIQNLTAWIPGVKNRLVLSRADAQLTEAALVLNHLTGQFEHSSLSFAGTITRPWVCAGAPPCSLDFDLHTETLNVAAVTALLGANDKGWNIPFLSGSAKLPDFRAQGTLSSGEFTVSKIPLEKFSARVEVDEHSIALNQISASIGGGVVSADWRADWSGAQPHFISNGSLTGVTVDQVTEDSASPDFELLKTWLSGQAQVKYSLQFDGKNAQEMMASANGHADFVILSGTSRSLLLEASKPLRFQNMQGKVSLENQTLTVLPTRIRAESRIYEVSGTVSLAGRQADLKVSNGGARWLITGALNEPQIAVEPVTARTASTHAQ